MKKTILLLSLLCCGFIGSAQQEIIVNNATEFVRSIGPNRTIIMNAGEYNLAEATEYGSEYAQWTGVHDGAELWIENVDNLKIHVKGKVKLIAQPRYAWVLGFSDCKNLEIIGLTIGHAEAGYCTGGVLSFEECSNVTISKCDLYGSGTEGILMSSCTNIKVNETTIHDCTYDLLSIANSSDITFTSCGFVKTGEFDLVYMRDAKRVKFLKCTFSENWNGDFMPYLFNIESSCDDIKLEACKIKNNKVTKFVNSLDNITLKKNKFSGNTFNDFTDDFLNKNQVK
jgi:parallel beta-helix repeat protein